MRNGIVLILVLFILRASLVAQSTDLLDFSEQIDEQVWRPFVEAYESNNGPMFVSLHTDDIIRITKWGIREGIDFHEHTLERYAEAKAKRKLNFKFEQRIHSSQTAYEVGYFEIITPMENGDENLYYGRFSVVLKKIEGIWKIAQDYDTDVINGDPITKADYMRLPEW